MRRKKITLVYPRYSIGYLGNSPIKIKYYVDVDCLLKEEITKERYKQFCEKILNDSGVPNELVDCYDNIMKIGSVDFGPINALVIDNETMNMENFLNYTEEFLEMFDYTRLQTFSHSEVDAMIRVASFFGDGDQAVKGYYSADNNGAFLNTFHLTPSFVKREANKTYTNTGKIEVAVARR